jgi:hypothetical protein
MAMLADELEKATDTAQHAIGSDGWARAAHPPAAQWHVKHTGEKSRGMILFQSCCMAFPPCPGRILYGAHWP